MIVYIPFSSILWYGIARLTLSISKHLHVRKHIIKNNEKKQNKDSSPLALDNFIF